jgi:arsenite-transporting ATPase
LERAGIKNTWWVVNQCLSLIEMNEPVLSERASAEKQWIDKASEIASGNVAAVAWMEMATPERIAHIS